MKTAGIVAEYNPFHNGHLYHIEETKKAGYDYIVSVMSSNVVQRSEVSSFSKWTRASMAVKSGVNLVVELPAVYSVAGAEKFAFAGVSILNALGVVDALSFGSELGEISPLLKCADACSSPEVSKKMLDFLNDGITYAKAREKAVGALHGTEISKLLRTPNNILAIEYLKAIKKLGYEMIPFTVKRKGAKHDSLVTSKKFASATLIRERLYENNIDALYDFIPNDAFKLLKDDFSSNGGIAFMGKLNELILYKLRTMTPEDFLSLPDVSEGLEYKLSSEAKKAVSVDDFLTRVKTKRYTLSRIKRIIMYALLDIKKEIIDTPPPYIRILAFDEKGQKLLKKAKQKASLPIYHSFAKLQKDFPLLAEKEALATDLFRYACPKIPDANSEYSDKSPFCLIK